MCMYLRNTKTVDMYSVYVITLHRSGTRPVAKLLRSIRPEHRGTFHTQY